MLITSVGNADAVTHIIAGVTLCLIATSCYGLAGYLTKRWISAQGGLDPKIMALGSQLGASLFLLPFLLISVVNDPPPVWFLPEVWASLLALGLLCTAFAYILYFRLLSDIGPLRSLTVTFLIPPFGIVWGYLVLGETINEHFISGGLLICLSVWLIISPSSVRPCASHKV